MAVVSFAGTTLWNNAGTGIGRVLHNVRGGTIRWISEDLPGGNGGLLKNNGRGRGQLQIVCQYYADDTQQDAIYAAWLGVRSLYDTVVFPAGESSRSLNYCALIDVQQFRPGEQVEEISSGDVIDAYTVIATFDKLRHD
jgi:hypothetical protein